MLQKTDYTFILVFLFKLILGISFIWASYTKIQDPAAFAKIIYGYDLFPGFSINIIAIVVPFIELVVGFSLIMRLYPKSALLVINIMLVVFICLIGFNLIRGHEFDCGCFGSTGLSSTASAVVSLVRDFVMLGMGVFLWKKMGTART